MEKCRFLHTRQHSTQLKFGTALRQRDGFRKRKEHCVPMIQFQITLTKLSILANRVMELSRPHLNNKKGMMQLYYCFSTDAICSRWRFRNLQRQKKVDHIIITHKTVYYNNKVMRKRNVSICYFLEIFTLIFQL